jgi:hypothetical protein
LRRADVVGAQPSATRCDVAADLGWRCGAPLQVAHGTDLLYESRLSSIVENAQLAVLQTADRVEVGVSMVQWGSSVQEARAAIHRFRRAQLG